MATVQELRELISAHKPRMLSLADALAADMPYWQKEVGKMLREMFELEIDHLANLDHASFQYHIDRGTEEQVLDGIMKLPDAVQAFLKDIYKLAPPQDTSVYTYLSEIASLSDIARAHFHPPSGVAHRMHRNLAMHSKVEPDAPHYRLKDYSEIHPLEYLALTGIGYMATASVPFSLTKPETHEKHGIIIARTRHGKTQLLQTMIYETLRDHPHAVIVMDSQSSESVIDGKRRSGLLPTIERLQLLRGHVQVVDASAPPYPALNPFDGDPNDTDLIDCLVYMFSALEQDLSSQQTTLFTFLSRLMLATEGATLNTMLDALLDNVDTRNFSPEQSEHWSTIETLGSTAIRYFKSVYWSEGMRVTRRAVAQRLFSAMQNPVFEKILGAEVNTLDLNHAIANGTCTLLNISEKSLGEFSPVMGRFLLGMILKAAYERPIGSAPCFVFIDEAFDIFDRNIEKLLNRAGKHGVYLRMATQHWHQVPDSIANTILSACEMKIVGGLTASDARTLAQDLHTTPEKIGQTQKWGPAHRPTACSWVVCIEGITDKGIFITTPFYVAEEAPQLSESEYKAQAAATRRSLSYTPVPKPPPPSPTRPTPTSRTDAIPTPPSKKRY